MMKTKKWVITLLCAFSTLYAQAEGWIRVNQVGYLPISRKVAVLMSEEKVHENDFLLMNAENGKSVKHFKSIKEVALFGKMKSVCRLDFSSFESSGKYYLKCGKYKSPVFSVTTKAYDGAADILLKYMRYQRCGYNPFFKDSCHTHDGYIVYHPTKTGQKLDVRGGWHDASDYLQYTTTSANAIYQMMFAYTQNPTSFKDEFDASGLPGTNGIPDIIDEIKWGLDWLNRMNPAKGEMYNQIADDRDHANFRAPTEDIVDYGYGPGLGRPVYLCTGKPQVRGPFTNATTGIASTAGKFASCFALGSEVLKPFYPEFAKEIGNKADDAYQFGAANPGACQTASVKSPYIYEEDNWTDDMELAGAQLYSVTKDKKYLNAAVEYARKEPVTPWMGADSARHYQWYPFMNMGHYLLAKTKGNDRLDKEFIRDLRSGIENVYQKGKESPFLIGVPFIWCSNNLVTAMITQCRLYRELSGDKKYEEMESSLVDWLLGCNPWGTSMIIDFPKGGDFPSRPHAAITALGKGNPTGGLVDGPVYTSIFKSLRGVVISDGEAYERFQPNEMVYHDSVGDYSTNEPTMDGTASLTYPLSALQAEGARQEETLNKNR